jgi:hypothetical protein
VKLCITALRDSEGEGTGEDEPYNHFRASFVKKFFDTHNNRQSIGVLAFEVPKGQLAGIRERYKKLHPELLLHKDIITYSDDRTISGSAMAPRTISMGIMSVLEVYAYYTPGERSEADKGTVLRFVERSGSFASSPGFANPEGVLPGLRDADPHFDGTSIPAYSDHWVSNVIDRLGFLQTLEETLGFVPKVEFNAGVIAAGAARIESTVIGNTSAETVTSEAQVAVLGRQLRHLSLLHSLLLVSEAFHSPPHLRAGAQEPVAGVPTHQQCPERARPRAHLPRAVRAGCAASCVARAGSHLLRRARQQLPADDRPGISLPLHPSLL